MNETVQNLVQQLSRATMLADAGDLPSLADVHTHLENLREAMGAAEAACPAGGQVTSAMALIEKVILRDVADPAQSIQELHRRVSEIQRLISGDTTEEAVPIEAAGVATPGAAVTTAPAAEATQRLSAEDLPLIAEFITEAGGHIDSAEAELLKLDGNAEDPDGINAIFRAFHTIKGVAGFLNLRQIGALAHAAENVLDLARKGKLQISGRTLDVILESVDVMKRMLGALDGAARTGTVLPQESALDSLVARLRAAADGTLAAGPVVQAPVPAANPGVVEAVGAPAPAVETATSAGPEAAAKAVSAAVQTDATVKVATTRLDALINMVGELVIAQSMVSQDVIRLVSGNQRTARNLSHLGKITRELQDLTMAMRMVPIQGVFQKMMRLVRDLARKAGKEIELHIVGGETELDRNLVEAVGDPLVHMVRNSADHGIEPIEDRVRAGKPPAGHIQLKAYQQAGSIVVEISDDGRGLNKQRILKKAREAGLVAEGQELSEQDIFRLIFAPGLSTAEKVTDVSGRGVGMDVVRRNVENLRGRIDISSVEGKGSTFAIRLPLTLAVIDGLVIKVGQERYILPITSIEQSLRPRPEQLSTVQNRGEMCLIRDTLVPLFRLHRLFNVTPTNTDPCHALLVLVQDGSRRCCLLVDELLGQQQVVIKSLGDATESVPGVSGGAILGDGTISLILDVPGLMDMVATT